MLWYAQLDQAAYMLLWHFNLHQTCQPSAACLIITHLLFNFPTIELNFLMSSHLPSIVVRVPYGRTTRIAYRVSPFSRNPPWHKVYNILSKGREPRGGFTNPTSSRPLHIRLPTVRISINSIQPTRPGTTSGLYNSRTGRRTRIALIWIE